MGRGAHMRPSLAFTAHYSQLTAARGGSHFFSLFYVSSNFKTQLFSKIDGHFLGTSCFVIANLGRLVAAKMRLSINCIEFAYSRPIVYPRPSLIRTNLAGGKIGCKISSWQQKTLIFSAIAQKHATIGRKSSLYKFEIYVQFRNICA